MPAPGQPPRGTAGLQSFSPFSNSPRPHPAGGGTRAGWGMASFDSVVHRIGPSAVPSAKGLTEGRGPVFHVLTVSERPFTCQGGDVFFLKKRQFLSELAGIGRSRVGRLALSLSELLPAAYAVRFGFEVAAAKLTADTPRPLLSYRWREIPSVVRVLSRVQKSSHRTR